MVNDVGGGVHIAVASDGVQVLRLLVVVFRCWLSVGDGGGQLWCSS